jgi:hypothetical protein
MVSLPVPTTVDPFPQQQPLSLLPLPVYVGVLRYPLPGKLVPKSAPYGTM